MKQLTVIFTRHGEKTLTGNSLTKRGRSQIEHLGDYLKDQKITKIISSTMNRSIQSAEIISTKLKLPFTKDPRIKEIDSLAPLRYKKNKPRIESFFKELIKMTGNVLVCSHGNINRVLISFILKVPPKNIKIVQIPSCINVLERNKNGIINLVTINETSHLPKKLKIRQNF